MAPHVLGHAQAVLEVAQQLVEGDQAPDGIEPGLLVQALHEALEALAPVGLVAEIGETGIRPRRIEQRAFRQPHRGYGSRPGDSGRSRVHRAPHRSRERMSALVGTAEAAVTSTFSSCFGWLQDTPRVRRTPSAMPFMPCR